MCTIVDLLTLCTYVLFVVFVQNLSVNLNLVRLGYYLMCATNAA